MQIVRYAFAAVAGIFVAAVVLQVFLAGMFLFADGERAAHIDFGYTIVMIPIVSLVLAALARGGRRLIGLSAALALVTFIQPMLVWFGQEMPIVAALHPVNALLILWLSVAVARSAVTLARSGSDNAVPMAIGGATSEQPGQRGA